MGAWGEEHPVEMMRCACELDEIAEVEVAEDLSKHASVVSRKVDLGFALLHVAHLAEQFERQLFKRVRRLKRLRFTARSLGCAFARPIVPGARRVVLFCVIVLG